MSACKCAETDCGARDKQGRCTLPYACNYGRFAALVRRHLLLFGKWKITQYQSGALVAKLHGKRGRVEVWGGDMHRNEVWAIHKGGKEHCIALNWHATDGGLVKYVKQACHELGISAQTRIPESKLLGTSPQMVILDELGDA